MLVNKKKASLYSREYTFAAPSNSIEYVFRLGERFNRKFVFRT